MAANPISFLYSDPWRASSTAEPRAVHALSDPSEHPTNRYEFLEAVAQRFTLPHMAQVGVMTVGMGAAGDYLFKQGLKLGAGSIGGVLIDELGSDILLTALSGHFDAQTFSAQFLEGLAGRCVVRGGLYLATKCLPFAVPEFAAMLVVLPIANYAIHTLSTAYFNPDNLPKHVGYDFALSSIDTLMAVGVGVGKNVAVAHSDAIGSHMIDGVDWVRHRVLGWGDDWQVAFCGAAISSSSRFNSLGSSLGESYFSNVVFSSMFDPAKIGKTIRDIIGTRAGPLTTDKARSEPEEVESAYLLDPETPVRSLEDVMEIPFVHETEVIQPIERITGMPKIDDAIALVTRARLSGDDGLGHEYFEHGKLVVVERLRGRCSRSTGLVHRVALSRLAKPCLNELLFTIGYHEKIGEVDFETAVSRIEARMASGQIGMRYYRGVATAELQLWNIGHILCSDMLNGDKVSKIKNGMRFTPESVKIIISILEDQADSVVIPEKAWRHFSDMARVDRMVGIFTSPIPTGSALDFASGAQVVFDVPIGALQHVSFGGVSFPRFPVDDAVIIELARSYRPELTVMRKSDEMIELQNMARTHVAGHEQSVYAARSAAISEFAKRYYPVYVSDACIALLESARSFPQRRPNQSVQFRRGVDEVHRQLRLGNAHRLEQLARGIGHLPGHAYNFFLKVSAEGFEGALK